MSYSADTRQYFINDKVLFSEPNATPLCHADIIERVFTGDNRIKSIMASRGLAKTTLLSTKLPLLTALTGMIGAQTSHYCLIVSDTASQAESIIADIESLYSDSEILQTQMELIRSVSDELEFRVGTRTYHIVGRGSGAKLRGIKRSRRRPDLIIIDDLSNDEIAMNPARREKLKRWLWKALIPSREPTGYLIINVFTPLHQGDAPVELHNSTMVDAIDVPIADTTDFNTMQSAWPDRFPVSYIEHTYDQYQEQGRVAEFMQEHFLQLVSDESQVLDVSRIRYEAIDLTGNAMIYIATDLAVSQSLSADRSVAVVMAFDEGMWKLLDIVADRYNPTEFMDVLFRLNKQYKPLKVGLETVGYQQAFKHHLGQEMMQRDEYMVIHELKDNLHIAKSTRIYGLTSVVNTGNLVINEELLDNPALQRLVEQIELTTREGVLSSFDDEIDCLASFTQLSPIESYQMKESTVMAKAKPVVWQLQTDDDEYNAFI